MNITEKLQINSHWNLSRESWSNHGSLKKVGGLKIDQDYFPDNVH